jgi:peptide/nickel transport system permease protein
MVRVVLRRLVALVPLLLGVSFVSFLLIQAAPGSFVDRLRLDPGIPPSTVEALVNRFGLDQPWYRQYFSWLAGALRGDLGISLAYRRPVGELLGEAMPYTLSLVAAGLILASLLGTALGVLAVMRQGRMLDRLLAGLALFAVSVPTLVVALAGLGLAAATGLLPFGGGSETGVLDARIVLPTLILSVGMCPLFFLQARGGLLEVLASDFVRAARSRGLSEARILLGHGLRPSLAPLISFAGASVTRMLNAAFIIEVVVGWPGLGRLALQGLLARDPFLILGVLVLGSTLILLANLASDLFLGVVDPRIRIEDA